MKNLCTALIAAVVTAGCEYQPTRPDQPAPKLPATVATPGPWPDSPADYLNAAQNYIETVLRPASREPDHLQADYTGATVEKGWCNTQFVGSPPKYKVFWFAVIRVNGKNAFGGFTGYQPHTLFYDESGAVAHSSSGRWRQTDHRYCLQGIHYG